MRSLFSLRIKIISLGLFAFLIIPKSIFGAELNLKIIPSVGGDNNSAVVEVRIDPQTKRLNVVEGVINFTGTVTSNISTEIETGGSVLTLWPLQPKYSVSDKNIRFTGGTPGGFNKESLLFRIRISSSKPGILNISMSDGSIYLNDGKGTKESILLKPISVELKKSDINSAVSNLSVDTNPPVFEFAEIGKDKDTYDGKYFISFNANDDVSGVAKYNVKEGNDMTDITNGIYILKDQTGRTPIIITAYDLVGNSAIKEITPKNDLIKYTVMILLGMFVLFFAWRYLYRNKKNKSIVFLLLFFAFIFGWSNTSAATMQLSSYSSTMTSGDTMTVRVLLNAEGIAVNNAEALIKFPTDLIDVVSVSKSNSVFSLWVEEPTFSNTNGTISFNGGVPNPGFSGSQGSVVSLVIRAKKAGQAKITFSDAAVRANDGLGTDVLSNKQDKTISIISKDESASVVKETLATPKVSTVVSMGPIRISSPTFPDQNKWYKSKTALFKWNIPDGTDSVQTILDSKSSGLPKTINTPAVSEKSFENLEDGIWYFKIRGKKYGVWGSVSTYTARVDNTEPQLGDVKFNYSDDSRMLSIEADVQDTTSGIDRYEIYLNDLLIKTIPASEFVNYKYSLALNVVGENIAKLVVFDYAGNRAESSSGVFRASGTNVVSLDSIPSLVNVNKKLFIHGKTQSPNVNVSINIRSLEGVVTTLLVKSDLEKNFFVLAPKLDVGKYEIWTEIDSGHSKSSSSILTIEVTSHTLITFGDVVFVAIYPIVACLAIIIILIIMLFYHIGRLHGRIVTKDEKVARQEVSSGLNNTNNKIV
jgi:hypothetical protein